ncbi:MAG: hypothetical protein WBN89_11545 [Prochlorococcaceae cyanobacterium]
MALLTLVLLTWWGAIAEMAMARPQVAQGSGVLAMTQCSRG